MLNLPPRRRQTRPNKTMVTSAMESNGQAGGQSIWHWMLSTEWIKQSRPEVARPQPGATLLGQFDEWEASSPMGPPALVRTLFLRGSECRFHCTMCDLWQGTYAGVTPPGDIPRQVQQGLADLDQCVPRPTRLKLYNASSFFDPKNIPVQDLPEIARLVSGMQRVTVECHPRLVSRSGLVEFCHHLKPAALELAMGLECVHPEVLHQLNKQMTVEDYRVAVSLCHELNIAVRAFVLLQPPWLRRSEALSWCQATIDAARDMGVQHVSVIPVRGGQGAMLQLEQSGQFSPPTARMLEDLLAANLSHTDCLVTVDLWDWDKLRGQCPKCSNRRRARLAEMNLRRQGLPAFVCENCDGECV